MFPGPLPATRTARRTLDRPRLTVIQGLYFLLTGLWPLVSIRTFQAVTGPKADLWLVKTVGVLVALIGGLLARAGLRRSVSADTAALAVGSASALGGVEVVYAARGRISKIYLLDAALEAILIGLWLMPWGRSANERSSDEGDRRASAIGRRHAMSARDRADSLSNVLAWRLRGYRP